jgi:hypothetical protein
MSCPLGPFASLAKSLHLKQQHEQDDEEGEGKTQPPTHTTTTHTDAEVRNPRHSFLSRFQTAWVYTLCLCEEYKYRWPAR